MRPPFPRTIHRPGGRVQRSITPPAVRAAAPREITRSHLGERRAARCRRVPLKGFST
ncbi:hypothetical protein IL992_41835 [Microbispora sp. NEAU-D428]|uniref:hypothetical protein n=1 Tax=Microbispora sitophila TaxID=2771537 RepID=UPI0018683F1C|nr:hypothetical protein [Microbispora sitophila]MBE3015660.1 hypothetical protein [Microbispora sitophila]